MQRHFLLIEDDSNIVDFMEVVLQREHYNFTSVGTGMEALMLLQEETIDFILLDLGLPDIDGMELLKIIRKRMNTPIIVISARKDEQDKVQALDLGADDYVTKPFSMRELMARVRTNLRRYTALTQQADVSSEAYEAGDLVLEAERFAVRKRGRLIDLTQKETDLLKFFMNRRGQVFGRAAIFENVWGYEALGDERTVDVTIRRLREKIEDEPGTPVYILTKRGVGYYFNDEIGKK